MSFATHLYNKYRKQLLDTVTKTGLENYKLKTGLKTASKKYSM